MELGSWPTLMRRRRLQTCERALAEHHEGRHTSGDEHTGNRRSGIRNRSYGS